MLSCLGLKESRHGSFLFYRRGIVALCKKCFHDRKILQDNAYYYEMYRYIVKKLQMWLGDYTKLIEIIHICVKTVCIISRKLFNYTNKKLSLNIYVIHGLNPGRQSPNYTNKKLSLNISVIHGFGSGRLSYDYTNFNSKLEGLRK